MEISINMAEKAELLLLPGINLSKAEAIIRERDRIFGFASRDEFMSYVARLEIQPHFYTLIERAIKVEPIASNSARVIDF